MNISNFIWIYFQEIIKHSDNNPTKFSVLSYAYFQMLYNFGTLFEKNGFESQDRVTAAKLLNWWFKNPVLYDGFTVVSIPNNMALCPSLNNNDKTVCIGEFIFDQGSSTIEPGVTPKERTVLQYKTLQDLANMAGLSRIYGGIHTFQTNEVSAELGDWVYNQTRQKLTSQFKFKSPY